ncbi:MAG: hypothetical protein DMD96_22995 [Candidatus Rokuibacteriota bacterium]|nr:MAG: hypothetical protein DMD96_22995 [Candidatus Rokubacteria bacterium]
MFAVIVSLAGCSSVGTTMPVTLGHELQPLNVGWQRYFDINWQQGERHGAPILSGRVENKYGAAAAHVQLHVDGLDAKGKVITRKVTWLGDDIPASNSTYFEVPVEAAPNYRVSVFAYDWLEVDGPRR